MALILVFVAASILTGRRTSKQHVFTGTVREWNPGESITIAGEQTDSFGSLGFIVRLPRNTRYEGADMIGVGSHVTIWYRGVGESHAVADKVRVNGPSIRRMPFR
ncbi:MAG TPA: hypothetical protein VKB50_22410 [Vicinamibacterales bacterium]|nr:hypothetical protein [Vicinamibacterales bacterium]